jgi:FixJ family two-component response regulator
MIANKNDIVFIVDDDSNERYIVEEIWKELDLKNPLFFFNGAEGILTHMKSNSDPPFIIMSDVNLPLIDGFQLRQILIKDNTERYKVFLLFTGQKTHQKRKLKRLTIYVCMGFLLKKVQLRKLKKHSRL